MPVPRPLNTWAMVVAVTRSPGLNQELERARGALPTTMLDIPLRIEQRWQLAVNRLWSGSCTYSVRHLHIIIIWTILRHHPDS